MAITAEERLKWWHEVRYGMFIHWGLYAVPAGEWKGEQIGGIGEWIMRRAQIPIDEYEQLANEFNPVKFDAEEWAEVAKQAGMKYLVITAKHHDGFCMFDSPSNPYNIVEKTPFKRDPMKELADACNKRGIKMCFYYSQAQDWHAPGGAGQWGAPNEKGWRGYSTVAEDFARYLEDVVKPNVRELLTNYGPIGLIWFDTPQQITQEQSEELRDLVHELQPECLVSGRVGHGVGDYGSLGDNRHPVGQVEGAWETPATLNDTWGYKSYDHNWKSAEFVIDLLVNCASKGVNYLLNVGPTAEGVIPQPSVDILKEAGAWLDRNGDAIYGTTASPFPLDPEWGRITCKGNTLYLLIKEWPADNTLRLVGLRTAAASANVLGAADASASIAQDGDILTVALPAEAPEEIVSVVAVEFEGVPEVDPMIIQDGDKSVLLPAHMADLEGGIVAHPQGYIEKWTDETPSASWTFRATTPGDYAVTAVTRVQRRSLKSHPAPELHLTHAGTKLSARTDYSHVETGPGARGFEDVETQLGTVRLDQAGEQVLQLSASDFGSEPGRGLWLSQIVLTPVS